MLGEPKSSLLEENLCLISNKYIINACKILIQYIYKIQLYEKIANMSQ